MVDRLWQLAFIVAYRLAKCWWWLRRPESRGAYVAVWVGDRILMIRNSYKREYSIPAGGVARGETFSQAAVRELFEEVGIPTTESELKWFGRYRSRCDRKQDESELFELHLAQMPEVLIDNREVVWAEFHTLKEARQFALVPVVDEYLAQVSSNGVDSWTDR